MKLAIQTLLLPGDSLAERFENAARFGFDGVEVAIGPSFDLIAHVDQVRWASEGAGIPVCAICTHPTHDPLHPDPAERAKRFHTLTLLIEAAGDLGAAGVVSVPVRPPDRFPDLEEEQVMQVAAESFSEWAARAPAGDAAIFLEPLNRYEAWFLNRVEQAAALAELVASPRVQALGDLFHMNIEESALDAPLTAAGSRLGLVHIADNNRFEPGAGCLDFRRPFAALKEMNYQGYLSIECWSPKGPRLSTDPEQALPRTVAFLRDIWAAI